MLVYWLLFCLPVLGLITGRRLSLSTERFFLFLVSLALTFIVGLRHEVGGDWFNYLRHYYQIAQGGVADVLLMGDLAYYGLNLLVASLEGSIYLVNFISAAIACGGVVFFCARQPMPWLALLVAMPYLIIVVGMGYTRQAAAIGLVMVGMIYICDGRILRYVIYVLLAALFHKSAVLMLPLAALMATKNRAWSMIWVLAIAMVAVNGFVANDASRLWDNYVTSAYESSGGLIRVSMNVVPAVLFFMFGRRIFDGQERQLWLWVSFLSLASGLLVFIAPAAVDRAALYFIPLQLAVLARLPTISRDVTIRSAVTLVLIGYCGAIQFVWMNYAVHARYWLPYQSVLSL